MPPDALPAPSVQLREVPGGGHLSLEYPDATRFLIARDGRAIWMDWRPPNEYEDALTYLLGPVLAYVLRLLGRVSLHASAVAIDGRALALVGPPQAGKSTLAAALAMRGLPMLTEDVLPFVPQCDGRFWVAPGYPLIRLWPESVEALLGSKDVLPLVSPNWDKRSLDLEALGYQFQSSPLPLGAIYVLQPRSAAADTPRITAPPAPDALISLVANTSVNYLLSQDMRAHEFRLLSQLVGCVPVRTFTAHADTCCLGNDCDRLIDDFRRMAVAQPG